MENIKQYLKTFAIRILKSIFFKILIIVLIIVALLSSFVYFITIDDGTYKDGDWGSTAYAAEQHNSTAKIGSNGITVDETAQELWDKMIEEGSNVDDYLDSPEELQKLMNAELITQYPKIGNSNAQLDGIIEFERHYTDGSSQMLTYIDMNTFNSYVQSNNTEITKYFTLDDSGNALIGVVDKKTETLNTNDSEVKVEDYSDMLTEEDRSIISGNYSKTVYTVTTKPINYKNVVSKYTMPFQYLWCLLVIGDDKDFVLELADLVENSQIIISIYDNITTTVYKDITTYNKETRVDTYARVRPTDDYDVSGYPTERYWVAEDNENYDSDYPADYNDDPVGYHVELTTENDNNTPVVDLTRANVWIVDYSKEYVYQARQQTSEDSNPVEREDTEFQEVQGSPRNSNEDNSLLTNVHARQLQRECREYIINNAEQNYITANDFSSMAEEFVTGSSTSGTVNQQINVFVNIDYVQVNEYKRTKNISEKISTTVYSQNYVASTPSLTPKVEKNEGEINFVTILCKPEHEKARNLLTNEIPSWLFEVLELNPDTANMVELTKYLLNKVLGRDKFETEFDFSIYADNSFNSVSFSSNILFDYLCSWENTGLWQYLNGNGDYSRVSKYITEDGSKYICYSDIASTRNFGFGVCHSPDSGATYYHVQEYLEEGIIINNGQYNAVGVSQIDRVAVDNVKTKLINSYQESVKNQLQRGGILDQMSQAQIDALTAITYQYGNIGNFVEAYKQYGNTEALINAARTKSGKTYFNSNVESNGRSQANWRLFHEGIYIAGNGQELFADNYVTGDGILGIASQIWRQVATSGVFTSYGAANGIPPSGPSIDCSGFVSWVLYEYGYKEEFYYQHSTSALMNTNWNAKYGWTEIPISSRQDITNLVQPGDIIVRVGEGVHHCNIVVSVNNGRLLAYDCGNRESWLNSGGNPVDKTYFLTCKGNGKIIRVK